MICDSMVCYEYYLTWHQAWHSIRWDRLSCMASGKARHDMTSSHLIKWFDDASWQSCCYSIPVIMVMMCIMSVTVMWQDRHDIIYNTNCIYTIWYRLNGCSWYGLTWFYHLHTMTLNQMLCIMTSYIMHWHWFNIMKQNQDATGCIFDRMQRKKEIVMVWWWFRMWYLLPSFNQSQS